MCVTDLFGTSVIQEQQYAVYSDLAGVLETDFAGDNKVLTELSDFYDSCIAAKLMSDDEFVEKLIPAVRKLYQDLGTYNIHFSLQSCKEQHDGLAFFLHVLYRVL